MPKLNQVIALTPGRKANATKALTAAYHKFQKDDLLFGVARTYQPKDELGEQMPPERKNVQVKVRSVVKEIADEVVEMFNAVATQDYGNTQAVADVVVDGTKVLEKVPVTFLLFLEKQSQDLLTLAEKLPVLDPAEKWTFDATADCFASESSQSNRTKKVPQRFVKYEATKEHAAQVDVWQEDVVVGQWTTKKFSGAISAKDKNEVIALAKKLLEAVKTAREEANSLEIKPVKIGDKIFDFVFGRFTKA